MLRSICPLKAIIGRFDDPLSLQVVLLLKKFIKFQIKTHSEKKCHDSRPQGDQHLSYILLWALEPDFIVTDSIRVQELNFQ